MPFIEHLVADSAAFIRNDPLQNIGVHVYTTQEVINEIRHKPTLQRLQCLPYELEVKQPSEKSYAVVAEFAKKTGDFAVLSRTDLLVLALTYELTEEHLGIDHLRPNPVNQQTTLLGAAQNLFGNPRDIVGFHVSSKLRSNPMASNLNSKSAPNSEPTSAAEKSENVESQETKNEKDDKKGEGTDNVEQDQEDGGLSSSGEEEEEEDSEEAESTDSDGDEDDWITEDNLMDAVRKMNVGDKCLTEPKTDGKTKVACLTTDFAMQNVIMHMNLHLVSADGFIIRRVKSYILRCRACFKTTTQMTKRFCSSCGHETLDRVTVTVNSEGETIVHLSKRRMLNTKGMRHCLPNAKGGKHSNDPIIMEDQRIPHNRLSKKARAQLNPLDEEYTTRDSPFLMHDVNSRSAKLGVRSLNKPQRGDCNGFKSTKKRGGKRR